jgi:Flp pilus assembly protein TadG
MKRWFRDEAGSAVLEFIMIALPLFIPLSLYLNSVNGAAQGSMDLQNISRQVARAYTTSTSEDLALVRANEVLSVYQNQILPIHGSREILTLAIQCGAIPCLSPNAKVSVTVTASPSGKSGSATQIVDAWRSSG